MAKIANIQLKIDGSSATVTKLEQEAEKIENRLDNEYKKTNSKDYDKLNKNISSRMSELEKQNGLLKEQQSIAGKDTEKWKELDEQIRENNLSVDEFNKKITENKIAKIQIDVEIKGTALNKLEKLLDKLSWNTSLKGVFGGLASEINYTLQNKNLMNQIKNLNQTNALLMKQQKEVKKGSSAWNDYQSKIQDNNSTIRNLTQTMAENAVAKAALADEKANKKIEKYDSQDELSKAKSENATNYKTQNKYIDKEIANIDKRLSAYRQAESTNLLGLNSSIKSINKVKTTSSNKSLLAEVKKYTGSRKEVPNSLLLKASKLNDNGNLFNKLSQYNAFLTAYQTSKDTAKRYGTKSKKYQKAKENLETARTLRDKMKAIRDGKESDYVESLKRLEQLKSLKGYAKGSKHATEDFAWTQEEGNEIIRTSDGAILTPVGKGGMVFTNEMSQRLWELSKNPNLFKNNISGVNINIPDIQSAYQGGDVNITFGDIELPNVTDSAEFANSVESAIRNAVCKNGKTLNCITEAVSAKQLGKDFLADTNIDDDMTDEELQKNTYIGLFVGMGYDRGKVENTWNNVYSLMKQFNIPFEKAMGCMMYAFKYDCKIEIPLRNICGIDISGIEKSMPIYQREATKCLCGALVSGLMYLLADKLEKELEK